MEIKLEEEVGGKFQQASQTLFLTIKSRERNEGLARVASLRQLYTKLNPHWRKQAIENSCCSRGCCSAGAIIPMPSQAGIYMNTDKYTPRKENF